MEFSEIINEILFTIGDASITLGKVLAMAATTLAVIVLGYFIYRRWLPILFEREDADLLYRRRTRRLVFFSLLFLLLYILLTEMGIDYTLYRAPADGGDSAISFNKDITVLSIIKALLIFQFAHLLNWLFSEFIVATYKRQQDDTTTGFQRTEDRHRAARVLRPVIYMLALIVIIKDIGLNFVLDTYTIPRGEGQEPEIITLRISLVLGAIFILLFARFLIWLLTQLFLSSYYQRRKVNSGSQYAINRLLSYLIYVLAVLQALQYLKVDLTLLWGGAAALLVGIGLGLQQTFNDLICGIILLFERTAEVGDVVEVGGMIGSIKQIGLRTSLVETRDSITVIVPNSKLVGENVINWSHFDKKARFHVDIGIAYGSDTQLVRKLLEEVAENHRKILKSPAPFVRFIEFGDSSLNFQIHFWTREFIRIEDVKSDIRFAIDKKFREHDIVIPFPQRDLWIKEVPKSPPPVQDAAEEE